MNNDKLQNISKAVYKLSVFMVAFSASIFLYFSTEKIYFQAQYDLDDAMRLKRIEDKQAQYKLDDLAIRLARIEEKQAQFKLDDLAMRLARIENKQADLGDAILERDAIVELEKPSFIIGNKELTHLSGESGERKVRVSGGSISVDNSLPPIFGVASLDRSDNQRLPLMVHDTKRKKK